MRTFFLASFAYFALALGLNLVLRDADWDVWTNLFLPSAYLASVMTGKWTVAGAVALGFVYVKQRASLVTRSTDLLFAALGFVLLMSGFMLFKPLMPSILPFWADPMLADLDAALHFGTDPWRFVHEVGLPFAGPGAWTALYTSVWAIYAPTFPVVLALIDNDRARVLRFTWLYFFAWTILGSVLALGFLSVGPVYYDRLEDAARFVGLRDALDASGLLHDHIGGAQQYLWNAWIDNNQSLGSGISAFPSMHVAGAMLPLLYLLERSRPLALIAGANLLAVLWFSVVSGYHYAIDGYASIIGMLVLYALCNRAFDLRKRSPDTRLAVLR